jgi:murein DD-endopeptidase MepM/ murein hydrolase activator NlpD
MGVLNSSKMCRTFSDCTRRLLTGVWLAIAVVALTATLLVACSGSSSSDEGLVAGVQVQRRATTTATVRLSPSMTKTPPSPTEQPSTPTPVPATATAEPTAEATSEPTPLGEPTVAPGSPSPVPPAVVGVSLSPPVIPQGGATTVQVASASAAAAVADFAGRQYPLLASDGTFWGVLGVPARQPPGAYPVLVTLVTADGRTLRQMQASLTVTDAGYPVEYVELSPEVAALLDPAIVQEELDHRAAIYSAFTPERLWSGLFIMPVQGPISGVYGAGRSYNGGPVTDYHRGTDISAEEGTPVVAANTGRVAFAGDLSVRGRSVILDHGAGVFSAYHHLSELAVVQGQLLTKGDLVGLVGHTGLAEGPHLHWEIVVRGVEVDALLWTQTEYGPVPMN